MIEKTAEILEKLVSLPSRILGYICMVVIVLMTLVVVANVCARRIFHAPIQVSYDLVTLGFSLIVFLPLAWSVLNNRHIELDIITARLPKIVQQVLEVVMILFTTIVLGLLGWRLCILANNLQAARATTGVLEAPLYPFIYSAAIGSLFCSLAFLVRFLNGMIALKGKRS